MDIVNEKDFRKAESMQPIESENSSNISELTEKEIEAMLQDMDNPVLAQKRIAVQVKHFLDNKIKTELRKSGNLSDSTRRWIESYNDILEKIQKALHGDKSISLNLHAISHADIAAKIRNSN